MKVSSNKRTLEKDGKHFFYLADTCWSAFTNIEEYEWEYYLDLRRKQGFNTLQINVLPQWDASVALTTRTPFIDSTGDMNSLVIDESYFQHCREMCLKAKEYGFELALVALWCNYIPGTWANSTGKSKLTLPLDFLEPYAELFKKYFHDVTSLIMVSGDTDFSELSTPYYVKMSKLLRDKMPDILQTMHIKGRYDQLPNEIAELVDVYFYQSGHNSEDRAMPYKLAESFYLNYEPKPIINSEPCYELMGYSRKVYGRWTQREVREAAWQSILSGACAGITYGAAGIYSWHRTNIDFSGGLGEAFDKPNAWNDAIKFPGAWDYGYIKYIIESYSISNLIPSNDIAVDQKSGIRIAQNEQHILIYLPHNTEVKLVGNYSAFAANVFDLTGLRVSPVNLIEKENHTLIPQHAFLEDVVIIINKEKNNG